MDPRTPVLVGAGQLTRHIHDLADATEPADMMADVVRAAAADAGSGSGLLNQLTGLWTVKTMGWRYVDPCALVAERLGVTPAHLAVSADGGNMPQALVAKAAHEIIAGRHDAVAVCGAEAVRSWRLAKRAGQRLPFTSQDPATPRPEVIGDQRDGTHALEGRIGLRDPVQYYPLFESAIRHRDHRSIAEHQSAIAAQWSRFSDVAAVNPHAWLPVAMTAAEIAAPRPDNRMICFPYTKYLNANIEVDMAAAVIVCSAGLATRLAIPRDRWVFPVSAADATDTWYVSHRHDLHISPAIRQVGRRALQLAQLTIDDIAHIDLYACFPCAVRIAADALDLPSADPHRPLTLTGGLTFGGGPGNNYGAHSLATLMQTLRADPRSYGLVTGNGWFLTKHAVGVYSAQPPRSPFRVSCVQDLVDRGPRRDAVANWRGSGVLETYTVAHSRDGEPERAFASFIVDGGARAWAASSDADVLAALETEELLGTQATISDDLFMPTV